MIKYSKKYTGKLIALVVVIAMGAVIGLGCYGMLTPVGWSGVVIDGDVVFSGTSEGTLAALDASSGNKLDDVYLEAPESENGGGGCLGQAKPVTTIYGTPAVYEDMVYVGSYMKISDRTQGKIYAFEFDRINNTFKGDEPRWEYPRGEYFNGPIIGGAVVALDKVYFGGSDGIVYALDAENGYKEWEFQTGDKIWSTPMVDGEILYVGSFDKNLYALDANSGEEIWRYEAGGGIAGIPLVSDGIVYFGSFDRFVYALDADNGELIWKSETAADSWFWAEPLAYKNAIYAACVDGNVYILNADNGKLMTTVAPDIGEDGEEDNGEESMIRSSPVMVDNLIILVTGKGMVYILDTDDNSFEMLEDVEEDVYAPLVADEGIVYVHTYEGSIYALDMAKKVRIWDFP